MNLYTFIYIVKYNIINFEGTIEEEQGTIVIISNPWLKDGNFSISTGKSSNLHSVAVPTHRYVYVEQLRTT